MLRVALTGGIATGKSFCLARFAELGVPTIDADALARQAVGPASAGLAAVLERFGPGILRGDGALDRQALGAIVFADRGARTALEAIIHPEVRRRIGEWFANLPPATGVAVADIPLLFETGQAHDFDRIVVCACDPAEQLRRVVVRDGLSEETARQRLAAQWPIAEKVARGHYVIRTDGTLADTRLQVDAVHRGLAEHR
ncbi:MAG TPA: dephospho-CoA kinase [Vicinamibacterales bacterium]|nr:dephospho-CoA kinase [Vicinamibacterales bacterium]